MASARETAVIRLLTRISLATALLTICSATPHRNPAPIKKTSAVANVFYPEVRLRKLHLVRPDLIPYPIYYDVYC
jgi:hypothetical protein